MNLTFNQSYEKTEKVTMYKSFIMIQLLCDKIPGPMTQVSLVARTRQSFISDGRKKGLNKENQAATQRE